MNARNTVSENATLDDLLAAYVAEARRLSVLHGQHDAATARLPSWAAAGPRHLASDGTKGGTDVGWPEVADLPTPDPEQHSVFYVIRRSPRDAWERATLMMPPADDPRFAASRRKQRLAGFAAVRRVIARMREQRAERLKVGLPEIQASINASSVRRDAIEDRMLALASGTTPADFAVTAAFEFLASSGECVLALQLLRRLAPSLSGLLRAVVDDLIEKSDDAHDDSAILDRTMLRGACDVDPVDVVARSQVEGIAA